MSDRHLHRIGLLLLFASALAVYTWLLDYVVVLQYQTPASFFVFSRPFLEQWLDHPGGLLLYAGRFLRQFFHYEWLGALVVAALVAGLGGLHYLIRRRLGQGIGLFHTFAPGLFLLALYSASTATVGLLVSSGAFLGYLALPGRGCRRAGALLATPVLYFVAGGYTWLFVAWVVAAEWVDQPWSAGLAFKLLYPALAVCLPFVAYRWVFPITLRAAWLYPVDIPHALLDRLFFAYLLALPLWPRLWWGARLESVCRSRRGQAGQAVLLAGLGAFLLVHAYDADAAQFAAYQRLYQRQQWDAILDRARRYPPADAMSQFFTNCALAHQGRLLDEMFHYPQAWGPRGLVLNFPNAAEYMRGAMYNSDLYFEMGHTNAAYRLAYNQLNLQGETYADLRRLAECAVVNGSDALAAKYLRILEKTLFHRDFAQRYQALLADPGAADQDLAELRARRPTVEIDIDLGEVAVLLALVESNPSNRMAFDYLTAWCLLDKASLPIVAEHVGRFREAGYTSLPAACQEALLVWENTGDTPVDRRGFAYDFGAGLRFQQFAQQLEQYSSRSSAETGLKPAFGGTYMYYYVLTTTPLEGTPPSSWLRLGNELYRLGETAEAVRFYRQAVLKHPESAEARAYLHKALTSQDRPDTAGEQLDRDWQLRSH